MTGNPKLRNYTIKKYQATAGMLWQWISAGQGVGRQRWTIWYRTCGSCRAALQGQSQAPIPCIILKSMRAKFFCRMENSQHICMRSRSIETYGKNMIQTRMTISFLNCCSPRRHRSSLDLNWMKRAGRFRIYSERWMQIRRE